MSISRMKNFILLKAVSVLVNTLNLTKQKNTLSNISIANKPYIFVWNLVYLILCMWKSLPAL